MSPIVKPTGRHGFILLFVLLVGLLSTAHGRIQAQGNDTPIVLDDQTPSIDAVIKPNNGASGAVTIELQNAQLTLTNSSRVTLLNIADARVTWVTVQLVEGAESQTLHLERLPGQKTAQVLLVAQESLPALTVSTASGPVTTLDTPTMAKVTVAPAMSLPVTTTADNRLIHMEFAQAKQTVQIVDAQGKVVLNGVAGEQMNGLAFQVTPGTYTLNVANQDTKSSADLLVALAPKTITALNEATPQPTAAAVAAAQSCVATVNRSTMALRSGPGTAYTTLGFVVPNSQLTVGGTNTEQNWILIQVPNSTTGATAWISKTGVTLAATCTNLTVFNVPTRNATAQAPVIIRPTAQSGNSGSNSGSGKGGGSDDNGNDDKGDDKGGDNKGSGSNSGSGKGNDD